MTSYIPCVPCVIAGAVGMTANFSIGEEIISTTLSYLFNFGDDGSLDIITRILQWLLAIVIIFRIYAAGKKDLKSIKKDKNE